MRRLSRPNERFCHFTHCRHRKLTLALDATVLPSEWEVAARADWLRDAGEEQVGLDREKFDWCWFELADVHTDSMEAGAYAAFLLRLLGQFAKPQAKGEWQADSDVIRAHFDWLHKNRERPKPGNSLPVCLARWKAWAESQQPPATPRRKIRPVTARPTPRRQGAWAKPQPETDVNWSTQASQGGKAAGIRPRTAQLHLRSLGWAPENAAPIGPGPNLRYSREGMADLVAPWVMWERSPRYEWHKMARTALPVLPREGFSSRASSPLQVSGSSRASSPTCAM